MTEEITRGDVILILVAVLSLAAGINNVIHPANQLTVISVLSTISMLIWAAIGLFVLIAIVVHLLEKFWEWFVEFCSKPVFSNDESGEVYDTKKIIDETRKAPIYYPGEGYHALGPSNKYR
jgi:hypothetical protein